MFGYWVSLVILHTGCSLKVTDKRLKEGEELNNEALAEVVDGNNFVFVGLDIANLAWSSDLEMNEKNQEYFELEEGLVTGLSLSLNSTDLLSVTIVSTGMADDNMTVSATLVMIFSSDYTLFYADKLRKKFKPRFGKTKPLGKYRISSFSARPLRKHGNETIWYKIVTKAPAPDESPEFFRNFEEMKALAEYEEDLFTETLDSIFSVESHKRTLEKVYTGELGQLHAHYQLHLAEIFLIDKIIMYEMYLHVNSSQVFISVLTL